MLSGRTVSTILVLIWSLSLWQPQAIAGVNAGQANQTSERHLLARIEEPFRGDLSDIRERRLLRVLVTFSKTNFFYTGGSARGFEYELLHQYESFLNDSRQTAAKVKVVFIPLPFEELLVALKDGRGDIAAAGLTITDERKQHVQFTRPYIPDVSEVLVLNRNTPSIDSLYDLPGRTIYVRRKSSYVNHLDGLSLQFAAEGRPGIRVVETDRLLATEDILELVNAGIIGVTVADHHIARLWGDIFPSIVVTDLAVNRGGAIAWAVRKGNPELLASLNAFVGRVRQGTLMGNILFKRYYRNARWIKNPVSGKEQEKLDNLAGHFKRYARHYGFDWLAIAAQAYQESGFDNSLKSPRGAVGIMQVLPGTAASPPVAIKDIHHLENNIHAGVRYLSHLRNRYFSGPSIAPAESVNFAWAAYNAGPTKVRKLRTLAEKRGFDPDRWFGSVEKISEETAGRETSEYVANINKYYIAYRLLYDTHRQRVKQLRAPEIVPAN